MKISMIIASKFIISYIFYDVLVHILQNGVEMYLFAKSARLFFFRKFDISPSFPSHHEYPTVDLRCSQHTLFLCNIFLKFRFTVMYTVYSINRPNREWDS